MIFCPVPKIGTTTWKSYFGRVSGRLKKANWTKEQDGPKHLKDYTTNEARYRLKNYMKVMVARHPLDRLVSAYNDKLVQTFGMGYLKPLIIDRVRHGISHIPHNDYKKYFRPDRRFGKPADPILRNHMRHYDYNNGRSEGNPYHVNFTEFLLFISYHNIKADKHWQTLQYMCQPCDINYDVILKVESIERDSHHVIQKMAEVSSIYDYTELQDLHSLRHVNQSEHSPTWDESVGFVENIFRHDSDQSKYKARANPMTNPFVLQKLPEFLSVPDELLAYVIRTLYWDDMVMFGYDFNMKHRLAECSFKYNGHSCC